jgi:LysM repeat protein
MTELRTSYGRFTLAALLLVALPLPLAGQAVEQQPERTHVVRQGDTLWDLARAYLADPFLWPEIFRLNAALVQDPARIYPNQRLVLPGRGPGGDQMAWATGAAPARTVFYEGYQAERRAAQPLPTVRAAGTFDVPVVTRGDFYRAGLLAMPEEVARIGLLTGSESPGTIRGAMPPQIALYDRVLLTMAPGWEAIRLGDRVQLLRQERRVRPHGFVWRSTGMATIADIQGNVATAVIVDLYDVVSIGDLVMPAPRFPVPVGIMPQPREGLEGRVVGFEMDATLVPTQAIAFIDLGAASGLVEGDVFVAYLPERRDRRGALTPAVDVAQLQVVRVLERTAAVRVVSLEHPRLEAGMPVRLVAKMP